jgi:hypothetical protein
MLPAEHTKNGSQKNGKSDHQSPKQTGSQHFFLDSLDRNPDDQ